VALAFISAGVIITVLFILGYRLDSDTGQLEQGALLQFESAPNRASIWIDGQYTGSQTSAKKTVIAGTHTFMVQRDGYSDWVKTLNVQAGTLTWLDYVRLVPKKLPVEVVATYPTLSGAKASPDLQEYIVQQKSGEPVFTVVDLRAEEVRSSQLILPAKIYGGDDAAQEFKLHQWDTSGRYVIVTRHTDDSVQWLVVDTQDVSKSKNVTTLLGVSLRDALFVGTGGTTLYGLTQDGAVRRLDLGSAIISRPLVTQVSHMWLDHETKTISYVGTDSRDPTKKIAGVYRDGDDEGYVIRDTKTAEALAISTVRQHSDDYVAVSQGAVVTILKGSYPQTGDGKVTSYEPYATVTMNAPVSSVSFSETGTFLVARAGAELMGYDMLRQSVSKVTLLDNERSFQWLDDAHLWTDTGATLTMRNFDGTNVQNIMEVAEGFDATLSRSGRYIYSIGERETGYVLQRVKMILD
jgi:hypothetical protein